jgi:aldehyde:ferredoxin oxidoreductase
MVLSGVARTEVRNGMGTLGYGKVYSINLSTGKIGTVQIDEKDYELYLGGKGLATRLLYDHTPAGLDPYDEEMVLIFSAGPMNGTGAPQSNRFVVTTKSPLTGGIANSTCGGSFATKLRKAGVALVMVRGKSDKPVYISINEDGVSIEDATELWGKGTQETQKLLPKGFGMAVIGPAGENLVRYAGIVSEERIAGRTGCGAVMGSKNLKAVIANGNHKIPVEAAETFKKFRGEMTKFLLKHPMTGGILPKLGTANIVNVAAGQNILPVNNYQRGRDTRAYDISGEAMEETYLHKQVGCSSCPIMCGRGLSMTVKPDHEGAPGTSVPKSEGVAKRSELTKGPEYETIGLMGSNLGCFDLKKIFDWNYLLDDLGMDSISCGGTIGFATELTSRGMLESDLSFDDHDSISKLIVDIAYRRGLGNDLAEGTKRMAEKYGGKEFAIHVKGLELPAYDPRGCYGQGLEYATTNRGGCHVQGATMYLEAIGPLKLDGHSIKAKPQLVVLQQNIAAALCSSVYCLFATYAMIPSVVFSLNPQGPAYKAVTETLLNSGPILSLVLKSKAPVPVLWFERFLSQVLGRKITMGDFVEIGERAFNMERLYNLREGLTAADDTLPDRLLNESTFPGIEGGVPLGKMMPKYYELRGWDRRGVPTKKTLKRLSIRN